MMRFFAYLNLNPRSQQDVKGMLFLHEIKPQNHPLATSLFCYGQWRIF